MSIIKSQDWKIITQQVIISSKFEKVNICSQKQIDLSFGVDEGSSIIWRGNELKNYILWQKNQITSLNHWKKINNHW